MKLLNALLGIYLSGVAAQAQETVAVTAARVERSVKLPGELLPYQSVELRARVPGFVESIAVDRGSVVRQGQALAVLSAPELAAQRAETMAKVQSIQAQRAEAEARVSSLHLTASRLQDAAKTPGAVAGNEVLLANKAVEASSAASAALLSAIQAAEASLRAADEMLGYLKIAAPFDGVVTERFAHPGTLAGPQEKPLLRLEQVRRLRLVVAVPESYAGAVPRGGRLTFTAPAYPDATFSGTVSRSARALDAKTRTLPIEVDVMNADGRLAPGMYPEVNWSVRRGASSLLVPATAIASNTERTFVVKAVNGKAVWVNVRRLGASGELVEVVGDLKEGDRILKRATDEIRQGSSLTVK